MFRPPYQLLPSPGAAALNGMPRAFLVSCLLSLPGCHAHRYVHWEEDWSEAAEQAAESTNRDAQVTLRTGRIFEATNVSLSPDSLMWVPTGSTELSTPLAAALAEIEGVVIAGDRRGGRGAAVGALTGFLVTGVPLYAKCLNVDCGRRSGYVEWVVIGIGTGVGALLGLPIGASFREWFHLVP